MSLPLLQTSPTVELEVPTSDYRLRANAVRSPDPSNGLVIGSEGLSAKRGVRQYPWHIGSGGNGPAVLNPASTGTSLPAAATADNLLVWNTEVYDPDGLVDLAAQPSRVTFTADARYWTAVNFYANPVGGTIYQGQIILVRNGSIVESVAELNAGQNSTATALNQVAGSLSTRVNAKAGDYLEVYYRWEVTSILSLYTALWGGGALTS